MLVDHSKLTLETTQRLQRKLEQADTFELRKFISLDGFVWLVDALKYFLEFKLSR